MSNLIGTLAKVALGVAAIKGVKGVGICHELKGPPPAGVRSSTAGLADQGQRRRAPQPPSPGLEIR